MNIQSLRSPGLRLRGGCRDAGRERLGQRRSAVARRTARLHDRRGQLFSRRRRRLGPGHDQPAADHRRPSLGGFRCARRAPDRRRRPAPQRRHERHGAQPRRQHRAVAADAGHDERPRAPLRSRIRCSRSTRRISLSRCGKPASTGSPWTPKATRRISSCARARARSMAKAHRTSSTPGNRIASRERACASTSRSPRRASTISIAGRCDRDRVYDTSISARYVSPDVIGYQDLDANGSWSTDADLRQRLVPDARGGRLGALSRRALGMGRPLGLDVGR